MDACARACSSSSFAMASLYLRLRFRELPRFGHDVGGQLEELGGRRGLNGGERFLDLILHPSRSLNLGLRLEDKARQLVLPGLQSVHFRRKLKLPLQLLQSRAGIHGGRAV